MMHKVNGGIVDARGVPFFVGQTVVYPPSGQSQRIMLGTVLEVTSSAVVLHQLRYLRRGVEHPAQNPDETIRTTSSIIVIVDSLPEIP